MIILRILFGLLALILVAGIIYSGFFIKGLLKILDEHLEEDKDD